MTSYSQLGEASDHFLYFGLDVLRFDKPRSFIMSE